MFNNFSNPTAFICSAIGAVENVTAAETAKLCAMYLGPALQKYSTSTTCPIPTNPLLMKAPSPDKIIYTDPRLAPGGAGPAPGPPETPPAVSAYTGAPVDVRRLRTCSTCCYPLRPARKRRPTGPGASNPAGAPPP